MPKLGKPSGIVKPLTDRQVMAAQLIATGFKKTDVAAQLNLTVDTVYLWNKNPLFRVTIAKQREDLLVETLSLARSASREAVMTLVNVMQDEKECGAVKVSAASTLLKLLAMDSYSKGSYTPLSIEERHAEQEYEEYAKRLAKEAEDLKCVELVPVLGEYEARQLISKWRDSGYRDWDWEQILDGILDDREKFMQEKIAELTPRLGEEIATDLAQKWEAKILSKCTRFDGDWDWDEEVEKVEQALLPSADEDEDEDEDEAEVPVETKKLSASPKTEEYVYEYVNGLVFKTRADDDFDLFGIEEEVLEVES